MHILKTSVNGNPNVGLYGFATDEYCLLGREVPENKAKEISKVLNVPVHRLNICGTSLVGVFCTGNSSCLLVPSIAFDSELKMLDKLGINYKVLDTKLTALGNNILCNDEGCLVNPDFSAVQKKQIRTALGVKLKPGTISELGIVGSLAVLNKKSCLVHRDASNNDLAILEGLLNLKCETGTVNMANPYIHSGVICNSFGFVVGDQTSGPEMRNVDEALGFLKG